MKKEKKDKKSEKEENEEDLKIEKPSYTYWKRDSDKEADHSGFQPQLVQGKVEENKNHVGSAWNKAGTWEEKKLNKTQVEEFLNEYIQKNCLSYKDSFTIDQFTSYSGDTYYVFSRGKIKFIYDCEIKLELKGINEYEGAKTKITLKEVANADLDEDFEFEYDSVSKKSYNKKYELVQLAKSCQKEVQKDIRKLFDELKEHYLN